jgi:hypothetical protein
LKRLVAGVMMIVVAGCASWAPPWRRSVVLLERGDELAARGDHAGAQQAYEELVRRYPDDPSVPRARLMRDLVAGLVAARSEVDRLRADLAETERARAEAVRQRDEAISRQRDEQARQRDEQARQRDDLAARDGEVSRLKAEVSRLTAEAERLRVDLENLKKIDLNLERPRR